MKYVLMTLANDLILSSAVSNAYKTIQDPEKLKRVKEILDEANALVKDKVTSLYLFPKTENKAI